MGLCLWRFPQHWVQSKIYFISCQSKSTFCKPSLFPAQVISCKHYITTRVLWEFLFAIFTKENLTKYYQHDIEKLMWDSVHMTTNQHHGYIGSSHTVESLGKWDFLKFELGNAVFYLAPISVHHFDKRKSSKFLSVWNQVVSSEKSMLVCNDPSTTWLYRVITCSVILWVNVNVNVNL